MRELFWALRWLRKNPLFTAAITAILALGIGANTAVFSIVDAVLLRPVPYPSSSRLVRIEEADAKTPAGAVPAQDYRRWLSRTDLFEKIAAHLMDVVTVTGMGEPEQLRIQRTSAGLFAVLGARAGLGRPLLESDGDPNAPNVAVLSDRVWRRLFHRDPDAIGRTIVVGEEVYTIVGVMPPQFEFPDSYTEMWVPLRLTSATSARVQVIARTREGISLGQLQSAMGIVARQWEREQPKSRAGLRIPVSAWRETVERQYELTLIFILAAVGLVLLIACADVGGLLLSRAVERQKEIAIRASLGAGLWRVMRQLLVESLVLAVLGSLAGIVVAHVALGLLLKQIAALPIVLPHIQRVAVNQRVLLFNTGLCLLLACLFSIAPVLLAARTDLQTVLRGGQGAGRPRSSTRLFSILIAAQAGFAFLLLVGSGLMIRSLVRLQQADHGFRPEHVLTLRVPIGSFRQARPAGKYDTRPRQAAYFRELLARLDRVPGVKAVALVNNLPLSGVNTAIQFTSPQGQPIMVAARTISSRYFTAMGIPLVAGRFFAESDQASAPPVVIVNEYLARQLFPDRDAVGQKLPAAGSKEPATVVGVVKNASQTSLEQPAKGELYHPYEQYMFGVFLSTIVVRTAGDPLSMAATLRKEIWAVDADQPVIKVATMDQVVSDSIWRPRFSAWVFSVLGGIALLLTSAGVYGVVAYTAGLRAREVGIRVALGAAPRQVMGVIVRDAITPLAAGLAISLGAGMLLSRLMASLLYEVSAADPVTYIGAGALLLLMGAAASIRPAWRAAAGDPLQALRTE